ncbi:group III truncated hemoglobin [Roseivirga sp. BDSF3-8]|uniref:group III truncated hemoglobin n=1 Tax=Roseivirga sp. BDSF3-8 TaxID=3241598 RepID=UPI0035317ED6
MHDIENRQDIEKLVDAFYKRAIPDQVIGKFFTEVVRLDWEVHIPVLCDFWETVLLGNQTYKGNPMVKHILLSEKEPLLPLHFDRWLELWTHTVHSLFTGKTADEAITRANQIAALMKFKVRQAGA